MNKSLFLLFLLLSGKCLLAQVTTSAISGKVMSDSEPLIGATVLLIHSPSGTQYGTISNSEGKFYIQGLRTGGPYFVKVSYVGCQTVSYDDITLALGETYQLNVVMKESVELDEIVITGHHSPFTHEKTGAATNMTEKDIRLLPSISRSLADVTRLSPYASGNGFGGRDQRMNNYTIDGANFNYNMGMDGAVLPAKGRPISIEAIEEVQVNIAPFDVRQTNFIGAGINAITKSGTNQFRGSAYTYLRNENFRGNTVDGYNLGEREKEADYTYGFTLGGPILKNKLFFFVNGEYENAPAPIHKWKVSADGQGNAETYTSRVTANDMEQFASVLKNKYGYDAGSWSKYDGGEKNYRLLGRIDWNIHRNHKFMLRYNYTQNKTYNPMYSNGRGGEIAMQGGRISQYSMAFLNSCYTVSNNVNSVTAELNSMFRHNMSNKLLASFTFSDNNKRKCLGAPFPTIDIMKPIDDTGTLYTFMCAGYDQYAWNNGVKEKVWSVIDNFTYDLGNHTLTAGISYESQYASNSYMPNGLGYYRYASFEDFANGAAPIVYALSYSLTDDKKPTADVKYGQFSLYGQDEYTVNNRFKLIYGIRLDLPMYLNDKQENPSVASLEFEGKKVQAGIWPKSRILASPRIGFNWDIKGNKAYKLRGGTGIFTGRLPFVFLTNMQTGSGMLQNFRNFYGNDPALAKLAGGVRSTEEVLQLLKDELPREPGTVNSITTIEKDFKLPQVWKSNLAADIRLPLPFETSLTLEGLFIKDINAVVIENLNMISTSNEKMKRFTGPDNRFFYPGSKESRVVEDISQAMVMKNTGKGYSYSLNATLNLQPVRNLFAMLAYTYTGAKTLMGNQGNQASASWTNMPTVNGASNLVMQPSQYNASPHRVIASLNYTIPYARRFATSVGLFYAGYQPGCYSYIYSGDMNNDGVNNDLLYIPRTRDELLFADNVNKNGNVLFSAEQQRDAFWKFVNQDPYLKKHKGEYAEAFGARLPWIHRFDLRVVQDISLLIGKQKNTLQLSLDILNIGNLLNDSWGVIQSTTPANNGRLLKRQSLTADNTPVYLFLPVNNKLPVRTFESNKNTTNCWQLQIGIRYIFN